MALLFLPAFRNGKDKGSQRVTQRQLICDVHQFFGGPLVSTEQV